jgi:hypothetical protein
MPRLFKEGDRICLDLRGMTALQINHPDIIPFNRTGKELFYGTVTWSGSDENGLPRGTCGIEWDHRYFSDMYNKSKKYWQLPSHFIRLSDTKTNFNPIIDRINHLYSKSTQAFVRKWVETDQNSGVEW